MIIVRKRKTKLTAATQRKLSERTAVLYGRALDRWNQRFA